MDRQCSSCGGFCKKSGCERENVKPKEWVGLTDEEKGWCGAPTLQETVARVEAKLKEKNT